MSKKKAVVVLNSGGIDSMLLLHLAKKKFKKVHSIFINYEQLSYAREELSSFKLAEYFNVKQHFQHYIEIPWWNKNPYFRKSQHWEEKGKSDAVFQKPFTIPFRNGLFLSYAISFASSIRATGVWYGATKSMSGPEHPDCTNWFVDAMHEAGMRGNSPAVRVGAPLRQLFYEERQEIIKKNDLPVELTWSCRFGGRRQCGKCLKCKGLRLASQIVERKGRSK